ncbi:MAG: hypothetical protein V2J42_07430 [Wenzhouxiangella sp.]|jgi:hypothetical protein|nr:hypothetical protein [Wenzhouxiangella sp.]
MKFFTSLMVVLVISLIAGSAFAAENVDPDNDGSQYAFGANLGWLNAEPLGDDGPGMMLQLSTIYGWLWSANSGWISLSCQNTGSCDMVDYGVTHDSSGNLSGYAWSPNIGWISFSCANTDTCNDIAYGVQVDLSTGDVTGASYAANAGWLTFSCETSGSCANIQYSVKVDLGTFSPVIFQDRFEG